MTKEELKDIRKGLKLSQKDLADILGIQKNTIYKYEAGILEITKLVELAIQHLLCLLADDEENNAKVDTSST